MFCNVDSYFSLTNLVICLSYSFIILDGQFQYPMSIAVDSNNNIYVVDSYNHCVQKSTRI